MDKKKLFDFLQKAKGMGYSEDDILSVLLATNLLQKGQGQSISGQSAGLNSGSNMSVGNIPITEGFGQKSPYDVFSGGVNYGVDYAVGQGTPVKAPEGEWQIEEVAGGSKRGFIGNRENQGYGNTIVIKNINTGEKIRTSHLSQINVKPGQTIQGGEVLGLSGATGNVTGPHTDVEYRNKLGALADILKTGYGRQLFAQK